MNYNNRKLISYFKQLFEKSIKSGKDIEILAYLYQYKNDGKFYEIKALATLDLYDYDIDLVILEMHRAGYVQRNISGDQLISIYENPDGEESNAMCKITPVGISYYENYLTNRKAHRLAFWSLLISIIALLLSVISALIK